MQMQNQANFLLKMGRILDALGIVDPTRGQILAGLNIFTNSDRHQLITTITDADMDILVEDDERINAMVFTPAIIPDDATRNRIVTSWNTMKEELAKLQGLILLKKIQNHDCAGAIETILGAVTQKTQTVNRILRTELGENPANPGFLLGGGDDDLRYRAKYLKYKAKYLNLLQK